MTLRSWWRSLHMVRDPDCRTWSWWRWQLFYAVSGRVAWPYREWPQPARWLLPMEVIDTRTRLLVTSRSWWLWFWKLRIRNPFYRAMIAIGALDVAEGDYYRNGRWRWDIWRAGREGGA